MGYKHIIFDIDGTLLDTEYSVLHSLQKTLKELHGKDMACEDLTFALGIPGKEALEKLGITDIPHTLQVWVRYLQEFNHTVCFFDGIEQVLDTLSRNGFHLGIVTSQLKSHYQNDFGKRPSAGYFETVVCADDTDRHKPSPAPLLHYMQQTKAAPEEVLYIGDSRYDMECARAAHVDFALAVWGSRGRIHADCELHTMEELLEKTGCKPLA
ncbi:MAG: HAD family hydrolase [Lachnospiraceae bacterium]|jgi:HAD superfamily hydrolase (TIGR01549 family)|nr:HAD family hydrolase [Lachnospiraceae bacterium]